MQKPVFVTLCIAAFITVTYLTINLHTPGQSSRTVTNGLSSVISHKLTAEVSAVSRVVPKELSIPSIGLQTIVLPVGLTDEQIVDVPSQTVGWYTGGAALGETGTVALDGHYKTASANGIFFRLSDLSVGDEIDITGSDNHMYRYTVSERQLVNVDDFPVNRVYNAGADNRLSIVTCAGKYDIGKADYVQRTIVYADLSDTLSFFSD